MLPKPPRGARLPLVALLALAAACSGSKKEAAAEPFAVLAMTDGASGFEPWVLKGGRLSRLADIAPGAAGSRPFDFRAIGDRVAFTRVGANEAQELWITDGTPGGTAMLDLPGSAGDVYSAAWIGGKLYFTAGDAEAGYEPWVSDGTVAGSRRLLDVEPGTTSSNPENYAACGAKVCFTAIVEGAPQLWTTDGTAAGTAPLAIDAPGFAQAGLFTALGTKLVFRAADTAHGVEPWVTDGTAAGTFMLKDIAPGADYGSPYYFTLAGGKVFFRATDPDHGEELWVTDGTSAGTHLVKDLRAGANGCLPASITALGSKVLFQGYDEASGWELYVSDGTEAGTQLLDLLPGAGSSYPWAFSARGGLAYFQATDAVHGSELWVTDGTAAGTKLLVELVPGDQGSSPFGLSWIVEAGYAATQGDLGAHYFGAYDPDHGWELWRTDGTAAGTARVVDLNPGSGDGLFLVD